MVHPWGVIYGGVIMWIALNSLIIPILRKKTKYPLNTQGDGDEGPMIWLFIFFGSFMFLFLKQIRLYRKHRYLKGRINYYKWSLNPMSLNDFRYDGMEPEIKKLERIYKLSKIHQQTKRNKIKKKLLCGL